MICLISITLASVIRTPILTSGVSAARQSFEAAPKDITSEYDQSFIDWHVDLMTRTAEDPALVVEELVNACTVGHHCHCRSHVVLL